MTDPNEFLLDPWMDTATYRGTKPLHPQVVAQRLAAMSNSIEKLYGMQQVLNEMFEFQRFCVERHPMVFEDWKKYRETSRYMQTGVRPG